MREFGLELNVEESTLEANAPFWIGDPVGATIGSTIKVGATPFVAVKSCVETEAAEVPAALVAVTENE
jgi:hypothetical protein